MYPRVASAAMKRRTWIIAGAAAVVLGIVALIVVRAYFWPEQATRANDAAPEGATIVATGAFAGAGDGVHHVSGTAKILRVGESYVLRFEDYDQTQGPDVFVYLTTSAAPSSKSEIESGLRILIQGGAEGGESTKEGSFQQPLPAGFAPEKYHGIAIWCDRFDTLFGRAELSAA